MRDQPKQMFSPANLIKSFSYAVRGIHFAVKNQHNVRIHLLATLAVCFTGWYLRINAADWRWLIVAIALVWFAELMNTAFEYVCDIISPQFHHSVKQAKDIAAGAVLVCVAGATFIGISIFWVYI